MDVGHPVLTNTARKQNIWLEKGRDLRRVTLYFGTNSKCGHICYCSRMNKKGEYTGTHRQQYKEHKTKG